MPINKVLRHIELHRSQRFGLERGQYHHIDAEAGIAILEMLVQ